MFPTEEDRAKTNIFVKSFTIIAVICASLIPTIIISPLVPTEKNPSQSTIANFQLMYMTAGLVMGIIIFFTALIFITKGVEEKEQNTDFFENRPSFINSLKSTLKNKTFLKFTFANMCMVLFYNITDNFTFICYMGSRNSEGCFTDWNRINVSTFNSCLCIASAYDDWKKNRNEKWINVNIRCVDLFIVSLFPFI